jgi:hypothetical protein
VFAAALGGQYTVHWGNVMHSLEHQLIEQPQRALAAVGGTGVRSTGGRRARTTYWFDEIRGEPIDADELGRLRLRAHDLYQQNTHIFEDEVEALGALGAVPLFAA